MMSRRASFDIFQGNATLFLFRDAFAPHRRDPACTDELAAPAPASEPEISPDGDPYGRGRMGYKPTVFRHFLRRETTHVYSVGVLTIVSTLSR